MKNFYYEISKLLSRGVLTLLVVSSVGCAEDGVDASLTTPTLDSFSVWADVDGVSTEYAATIDSETLTITIEELENGEAITKVDYTTPDGVTLTPAPSIFLSKWGESNVVSATNGTESFDYTIGFANYVPNTDEEAEAIEGIGASYTINLNSYKQQVMFCGSDMERTGSFLTGIYNPSTVVQWLYGDINWSICRVAFDKQQEITEGVYNFAYYDDRIESMKMLRQANPHLEFWATLKSDYNGYGSSNNLPDWICSYPHPGSKWTKEYSDKTFYFDEDAYIVFIAEFLQHMSDNGVEQDYLSFSKEWGAYFNAWRTTYCILGLIEECKDRGLKMPKITDPSGWSMGNGITFATHLADLDKDGDIYFSSSTPSVKTVVNKMAAEGRLSDYTGYTTEAGRYTAFDYAAIDCCALYHGFSVHDYQAGTEWYDMYEYLQTNCGGIPLMGDETGVGAGGSLGGVEPAVSRRMIETYVNKMTAYNGGLAGELMFEPHTEGYGSPSGNRAIYGDSGVARRMRSYYPMKEFSNMIVPRNNMKNLDYPNYINPDNKWVVESSVVSSSATSAYVPTTSGSTYDTEYIKDESPTKFSYLYEDGSEYNSYRSLSILAFANSIDSPDVNNEGRAVTFMVINYTEEYTTSNSVKITLGDFQIDTDRTPSMRCFDDDYVYEGIGSEPEVTVSGVVATVELGLMPPESIAFVTIPVK
ncbi:MAG: DUF4971 domain-containing protein [Rikenellaceae bacterium]